MYKISIIMPIYNMEKYLEESIKSIINQTIFNDIELILIDDFSTDTTPSICKSYEIKYSNIKYIRLKENSKMAGKPRNIGLDNAKGKYIMFIDSDDIFYKETCQKLYECIEDKNVNIVTANLEHMNETGEIIPDYTYIDKNISSRYVDISDISTANKLFTCSVYVKIINREFIIKNKIKFLEGLPAEDTYFSKSIFIKDRKAYFLNYSVGLCRQRTLINKSESNNLNKSFFSRLLVANKKIYDLMMENNEIEYYKEFYLDSIMNYIYRFIKTDSLELKETEEIIKESMWFISLINTYSYNLNVDDVYGIINIFKCKDENETLQCISSIKRKTKNVKDSILTLNRRYIKEQIRKQAK